MTHAPDPSAYPSMSPVVPWWWQLLDAEGAVVEPEDGRQEFPTRSDAESWVGEFWADQGRPFFAVFLDPRRALDLDDLFREA